MSKPRPEEWVDTPPNGGNGNNNNEMNAFAFIHWIDRTIKGKSPMKAISREYRLDSQLPVYRLHWHNKSGDRISEFNLGRRSIFHTFNLILDTIFQFIYGLLRLIVYMAILVVILRALQIPEYLLELYRSL